MFNNNYHVSKITGQVHTLFEDMSLFLKEVVKMTFNQEPKDKQRAFFLIGYKHKRGFSKRIYGDPNTATEGGDFKWQLRNIRWHLSKYSEQMNIYEDVLDDLTGFLLDTCYKCYLGSSLLTEAANQNLLKDSFEVCVELVGAIEEAEFYQNMKSSSTKFRINLEKKINALEDLSNPSAKALSFVEELLVPGLIKEITNDSIQTKPITKLILNSVQSQFSKDDSGICADMPGFTSTSSTPIRNMSNKPEIPGTPQLLANQSTNSSMVFIDTPTVKNKQLDEIKKFSQKRNPGKNSPSPDVMDGSFVMI